MMDELKNRLQDNAGQAKEKVGEVTGDSELQAEGRADQVESGLRQAAQSLRTGAEAARDAVKDALGKSNDDATGKH